MEFIELSEVDQTGSSHGWARRTLEELDDGGGGKKGIGFEESEDEADPVVFGAVDFLSP